MPVPTGHRQGLSARKCGLVLGIGSIDDLTVGRSFSPPNPPGTRFSPRVGGQNGLGHHQSHAAPGAGRQERQGCVPHGHVHVADQIQPHTTHEG